MGNRVRKIRVKGKEYWGVGHEEVLDMVACGRGISRIKAQKKKTTMLLTWSHASAIF
jgi:hypothetical protein